MPQKFIKKDMRVRTLHPVSRLDTTINAGTEGDVLRINAFPDGDHALVKFDGRDRAFSMHVNFLVPVAL